MGKRIDRVVLRLALCVGLYLFYAAAFHNIPMAIFATLLSAMLLKKIVRDPIQRRSKRRKCAAETIHRWAKAQDPTAEIAAIIERAYPGELAGARMELLARHPQGQPVTLDEVFALWKAHAGEERLAVICTCAAQETAHALARTLTAPRVRLLDAQQLSELIQKFPAGQERGEPSSVRPRRVRSVRITREQAPKRLVFGGLLLVMYWLLGNILYLFAALATLFFALAGFKKHKSPRKLFA